MKLIIDIEPRYCEDIRSEVKPLYYEAINRVKEAVRNGIPYEERPQGEWIMDKEHTKNPLLWYKCNLCGVYHSPTNFCPCCGAEMRKDGSE